MREHRITGNSRRTGRPSLTKADTRAAPSPHRTGRDFTADRPRTKTVGDITYIPTAQGWLYLTSWMDLATREIIGYSMADHHRAELVVDALDMATALGRPEPGCVIHSDRGSAYTSAQLRMPVAELDCRQSMGRTGSCFDNAAAESFWAVLKEEIGTRFWPDRATAHADIFDFVETFYNRRRLRKAHPLGLPHTPRDPPASPRSDPHGVTTTCPGSRGNSASTASGPTAGPAAPFLHHRPWLKPVPSAGSPPSTADPSPARTSPSRPTTSNAAGTPSENTKPKPSPDPAQAARSGSNDSSNELTHRRLRPVSPRGLAHRRRLRTPAHRRGTSRDRAPPHSRADPVPGKHTAPLRQGGRSPVGPRKAGSPLGNPAADRDGRRYNCATSACV
jgi:transposase InsO family protein